MKLPLYNDKSGLGDKHFKIRGAYNQTKHGGRDK